MSKNLPIDINQMFGLAARELHSQSLTMWLSFCFGIMQRKMDVTDLEMMQKELENSIKVKCD